MDVDDARDGRRAIRERVGDAGRHEDECPRPYGDLLLLDDHDDLALEDVERVVLVGVHVERRPFAGLLRDDREVEARRVGGAREELDVRDTVPFARANDDGTLEPHHATAAETLTPRSRSKPSCSP
jgi:hypothetical protein